MRDDRCAAYEMGTYLRCFAQFCTICTNKIRKNTRGGRYLLYMLLLVNL